MKDGDLRTSWFLFPWHNSLCHLLRGTLPENIPRDLKHLKETKQQPRVTKTMKEDPKSPKGLHPSLKQPNWLKPWRWW